MTKSKKILLIKIEDVLLDEKSRRQTHQQITPCLHF